MKFIRLSVWRSRYQTDVFHSSLTFPARLRCFDPAASLRRAGLLLLMVAVALYVLPTSVYVATAALTVSACGSLLLSRVDRRRFSCTVLRLQDCKLLDVAEHHAGVQGVLFVQGGFVSGLRSRMRLVTARGVSHGMRRLPLVLRCAGSVVRWQDADMDVPLEGDAEIHGAIGVVSGGRSVCLEVIYGSRMGERSRVLATRFSSSDGAVQSWDPELLVNPFFGAEFLGIMHTRVFDRVRPGSGSVKGAQASTEK